MLNSRLLPWIFGVFTEIDSFYRLSIINEGLLVSSIFEYLLLTVFWKASLFRMSVTKDWMLDTDSEASS